MRRLTDNPFVLVLVLVLAIVIVIETRWLYITSEVDILVLLVCAHMYRRQVPGRVFDYDYDYDYEHEHEGWGAGARLTLGCMIVAISLLPASAGAREPVGTLGLIQTPHNGLPALVVPGGTFDAVVTQRATLRLTGGPAGSEPHDMAVEWRDLPGGRAQARCTVAPSTPKGTYTIKATAGDKTDRTPRSVFVLGSFPDSYVAAHLSDTHIGAEDKGVPPEETFKQLLAAASAFQPAFILISGDLTHGGEPDQFRRFIETLDTCPLPTFVCPGNHDRQGMHYERFFGPTVYRFWFGRDAYLVFDTKDFVTADSLDTQDADLQAFRREIKPARWSIGVSHRYEANMGMRAQLVLFVDDPLDYLLFGHWHRPNSETERTVPWGTTPVSVTPAAVDGWMRLISVSESAIRPSEPQRPGTRE